MLKEVRLEHLLLVVSRSEVYNKCKLDAQVFNTSFSK